MTYYADTAYDSTKNYDLPPIDNTQLSSSAKAIRKYPVNQPRGSQCGELFSFSHIFCVEALQDPDNFQEFAQDMKTLKLHEEYTWASYKNPKEFVETLTDLMGFVAVIAFIFGGGGIIYHKGIKSIFTFDTFLVIGLPILLYYLGKYLLRNNLIKDKNNVILRRRTGMVTLNHKGKRRDIPFAEIDPYYTYRVNPSGTQYKQLWLVHRLSEASTPSLIHHYELHEVCQDWEVWQQYMDVSKPLPDLPEFELHRHKDPTTAEYDKKHNRPKDYWRKLDLEKATKMNFASSKASKKFPWGKTRQQALDLGWQPSGFGQGDWLRQ